MTRRKSQVAKLISDGLCDKEIGAILGLSHNTIRAYLTQIYAELGLSTRLQLALYWRKMTTEQLAIEKQYAEAAVKCLRKLGMRYGFDLLTTAQAILEGGWNPHYSGTWNPLGIKADHFNALGSTDVQTHETVNGVSEPISLPFQNYASLDECFADHARIFLTGPLAPKYKAWEASGAPIDSLCVAISFPSPRPLYATAENYLSSLRSMLAMQSLISAVIAARQSV